MTSAEPGHHLSTVELASYDLPPEVRQGIAEAGFVYATPIQAKTLPITLAGRDVAGQAQTGTGKTAAFLITAFTRLLRHPRPRPGRGPRCLVVAPTRELVVQIRDDAEKLGRHTGLKTLAVFGGMDYRRQRDALQEAPDLLVGTPGRLIDYEHQGATTFRDVEILVIDEADRMFDMGFIQDLRKILRRCPPYNRRQTMLFSATLSVRVMELAYEHTNNAQKVEVEPERVGAHGITEVLYHVSSSEKFRLLLGLLEREGGKRVLIFVNRRTTAVELVRGLSANGYPTRALAGNVPQDRRLKILTDFKEGQARRSRRDRRGLARPPHRGRLPRHQLRPAAGRGGLRSPHRPDRAARGRRGRRVARVRRLRLLPRRDPEADRPRNPRRMALGEAHRARRRALLSRAPASARPPMGRPARPPRQTPRESGSR